MPADDGDMDKGVLVPNRKQESHKARQKNEYLSYDDPYKTRLIVVLDGFVTFTDSSNVLGHGYPYIYATIMMSQRD